MTQSPVFVVGSPRSGTSILTSALLRAGYNGSYEGNFLPLIRVLERDVDRHFKVFQSLNPKVLTSKISSSSLKSDLAEILISKVVELHPAGPWLDKSGGPEMIEIIPVLRGRFPESRYIFAKRRAIENLVSRLVKFPSLSFEYHCSDWARTMKAWRALKETSQIRDYIEIDQREISKQPTVVAAKLVELLNLSEDKADSIVRTLTFQRPQETQAGTSDRVLSLEATGWSAQQVEIFHRICDEEMQVEGYSVDEGYWLKASRASTDV